MNKSLLDTDILSEIGKGKDPIVMHNAANYLRANSKFTFTSVSMYEVLAGMHAKSAPRQIERFLDLISDQEEHIPESADYLLGAQIRGALQKAGTPIGTADTIIAACAVRLELPLVTGNVRHYRYVQQVGFPLVILNWREL